MDPGRFERNRWRFWMWIALPVTIILLAILPPWVYLKHVLGLQAQHRAMTESAAELDARLKTVDAALAAALPPLSRLGEATDDTTRRINQAAQRSGFAIRSLNVAKSPSPVEGLLAVTFTVQGEGSLPAVVKWLTEVQQPGLMLRVEKTKLAALKIPSDEVLASEFVLVLYVRPS